MKKFFRKILDTINLYTKNILFESAASCSFGFVFSFIPIIMIFLTIAGGLLRSSPELLNYVISFAQQFEEFCDITPILNQFLTIKSITAIDFFLALWIIWMARRFFLSIAQAMKTIFGNVSKQIPLIMQIMAFLGEFVLILIAIVIILISFGMNKIMSLPVFDFLRVNFPLVFNTYSKHLPNIIFYLLLFIFSTLIYRFESRTHPKLGLCIICALVSTIAFAVTSVFINIFVDITKYNLIYGAISTLIILMMKVYNFFMIFLFFAQYIYVCQFPAKKE